VVTLSGLSKMDMFGASTGARACWLVLSDQIQVNGVRAREVIANLSAWLVVTPCTLAQDWALAALQSPLAALRRPSPYMRERRDFMVTAADGIAGLGVEHTDFGGTFYAPLAFPGLIGERFERLRNGLRERATVRTADDAFDFLLTAGVGGIPFTAFAGHEPAGFGTWQRLSYGSKVVSELGVFIDRVKHRIEQQGQIGSSAPAPVPARRALAPQTESGSVEDGVWSRVCTEAGYEALDGLDAAAFEAARRGRQRPAWPDSPRLTGTKHPDSTIHRAEQLARAMGSDVDADEAHATRVLGHLEWHPLVEARQEYEETIEDLLGPCNEVLLDYEGRQVSPEWLDVPEQVVLALLRHGLVPGEDCHLLFRVPNQWLEQDEEKIEKLLAVVARANFLFLLAARRLGIQPAQNAIYELTVPQVNARADLGALMKIGTLYRQAIDHLFHGAPDRVDKFLRARIPEPDRADLMARVARVRLVPLVENVGALSHLPDLLESFYAMLERNRAVPGLPSASSFVTRAGGAGAIVRVFVAMSDTAEQSGKIATDAAYALMVAGREDAERRLAEHARRAGEPPPRVTFLVGAGRAGFRGGFDPAHAGVVAQFARAGGVTLQGIRADAPAAAEILAAAYRDACGAPRQGPVVNAADRDMMGRLLEAGVKAHTTTLLTIAPLVAPFGGLVQQTRVRIRATGSVNDGRSIPEYPEERGGGRELPDNRDLRDAWPEDVTLPRAIVFNLACTTLGLPAVMSDLAALDKRAAVLLERHVPGYREILASELPSFVLESVALVFGQRFAEAAARRCRRASAAIWADVRVHDELVLPTCLFAMLYLRYIAEDSDSWDETKEHESLATRESELISDTSSGVFSAICAERPGDRWTVLQTMVDADETARLLLARELTIEERREFVDLRIEGWLRALPDSFSRKLRRARSPLREFDKDALTLSASPQMIAVEELRGSRGASRPADLPWRRQKAKVSVAGRHGGVAADRAAGCRRRASRFRKVGGGCGGRHLPARLP